jgi:hypothetical protein
MVEICNQVMAGLSYFPWNGSNCSVHDMASLLTESWLSDLHIDYALTKIFDHHCDHYGAEISNRHTFLIVSDLDAIVTAYKNNIRNARAAHKRQQLLDIENKIISGDIDSVAGVLHLTNHWTSLVISFKPPKILYGDSLGHPMPVKKATSFKRWVCHMLERSTHRMPESDISVYPLSITGQRDSNSCGLLALNAISHHYLPQKSPLLQPGTLSIAQARLELALDHLQDGAVSYFLYRISMLQLIIHHRLQSMIHVSHLPSSLSHPLSLPNHFQKPFWLPLPVNIKWQSPISYYPTPRLRNPLPMTLILVAMLRTLSTYLTTPWLIPILWLKM